MFDESLVFSQRLMLPTEGYILRNQVATARGSNLTQVPILKHGIRPAAACLKTVTRETASNSASSPS